MLTRGILRGVSGYDIPNLIQTHSAAATAFIARTSGLDATHTNAYYALIDGLVADNDAWPQLDALYILATQDETTAALNLVQNAYNLSKNGTPTFTIDSGYKANANSDYLDTGFNPVTASSPKFVQDSAHLSVWNLTNASTDNGCMGNKIAGTSGESHLIAKGSDAKFYSRINDVPSGSGSSISDPTGHLIGNRSGASAIQHYQNGSSIGSNSQSSASPLSASIVVLSPWATISSDTTHAFAAASIGASLSSSAAANFYGRLRTYMTAVGVP